MRLLCFKKIKDGHLVQIKKYLEDIDENDIIEYIKDITGEYKIDKESFEKNINLIRGNFDLAYYSTYIFKLKDNTILYVSRKLDDNYVNWLIKEFSCENWEQ